MWFAGAHEVFAGSGICRAGPICHFCCRNKERLIPFPSQKSNFQNFSASRNSYHNAAQKAGGSNQFRSRRGVGQEFCRKLADFSLRVGPGRCDVLPGLLGSSGCGRPKPRHPAQLRCC
jgi:hypothetical protein